MKIYDAAVDLSTETLTPGQLVMTKGQNVLADGLGGIFRIVTAAAYASLVATDFDIVLADTNVAHYQKPISVEGFKALGAVSGAVVLDCEDGLYTVFDLSTAGNITSVTIANPPQHDEIAFGVVINIEIGATPDTIAFGAAFNWNGGSAPAFDTASTKEVVVAFTVDGGTEWFATLAMQGLTV